jgi:hypothetical protein
MGSYLGYNSNFEITKPRSNCQRDAGSLAHRKLNTAVYRLEFSYVSSLIDMHSTAVMSAKKSLVLLREYISHLASLKLSNHE